MDIEHLNDLVGTGVKLQVLLSLHRRQLRRGSRDDSVLLLQCGFSSSLGLGLLLFLGGGGSDRALEHAGRALVIILTLSVLLVRNVKHSLAMSRCLLCRTISKALDNSRRFGDWGL